MNGFYRWSWTAVALAVTATGCSHCCHRDDPAIRLPLLECKKKWDVPREPASAVPTPACLRAGTFFVVEPGALTCDALLSSAGAGAATARLASFSQSTDRCVFYVLPDGGNPGNVDTAFRAVSASVVRQDDCYAVTLAAPGRTATEARDLATGVELVPSLRAGHTVALVVIDDAQADGGAKHGNAVADVARRSACGGSDGIDLRCPVKVIHQRMMQDLEVEGLGTPTATVSRQGLPVRLGSWYALARAIHEGLEKAQPHERIVLNLSLGWFADDRLEADGEGPRAVRRALEVARCHGAVVVAAGGNSQAGVLPSSVFLPAAWQTEAEGQAPLVYAVAGTHLSREILSSSHGGVPPLVALGQAQTEPVNAGAPMWWVGSSVATAVVSGIVARQWAGASSGGHEAVDAVYEGGCPLRRPAQATMPVGSRPWRTVHYVAVPGASVCGQAPPELAADNGAPEASLVVTPLSGSSAVPAVDLAYVHPQPDPIRCGVCQCRPPAGDGTPGTFEVKLDWGLYNNPTTARRAKLTLTKGSGEIVQYDLTPQEAEAGQQVQLGKLVAFPGLCSSLIVSGYVDAWASEGPSYATRNSITFASKP